MIIVTKDFTVTSVNKPLYIRPFYDIHYGASGCDVSQLLADIDFVKRTPNCYWFFGGDVCDSINISDKRKDLNTMALNFRHKNNKYQKEQDKIDSTIDFDNFINQQIDDICKMFKPIKDKCIGVVQGNHEHKVKVVYHADITERLCSYFNAPNLSETAMLRMRVVMPNRGRFTNVIDWYIKHGYGASGTDGARINAVVKLGNRISAQVYIMGHNHGLGFVKKIRLALTKYAKHNEPRLIAKDELYILGGTYYKTYTEGESSYGERKAYDPTPIGSPIIRICTPKQVKIEGGKSMNTGIELDVINIGATIIKED